MDKSYELRLGIETAYINGSVVSNNEYRPQFVSNNYKEAVLDRHGIFYGKSEVWIESENLYEVLYQMEV